MHTVSSTTLCIYHAPCNDGSAAAAALAYRLTDSEAAPTFEVRFVPLAYTTDWNEPLPRNLLENLVCPDHQVTAIYMVDVVISEVKYNQILDHLRAIGRLGADKPPTVAIDHHVSAMEKQEELRAFCDETYIRIGPGLSGATLVWHYFNERRGQDLAMPILLEYVADQDIWEWNLPDSHEVNAALNVLDGTVESMAAELNVSMQAPAEWFDARRAEGHAITDMVHAQVLRSARNVVDLPLRGGGGRLLVVNATSFSSELGNHLCEHHPDAPNAVALIYSLHENWSVRCSFRSIDGGAVNARALAERYGGGGHDNAAGCRFGTYEEFRAAVDEMGEGGKDEV